MAEIAAVPDWLAVKLSRFIREAKTGSVTLHFADGRVETAEFREIARRRYITEPVTAK